MLSPEAIERYLEVAIGTHVRWLPSGNGSCVCPVHDDHHPSFVIYPSGYARCYSSRCNFYGDLLNIISRREGKTFNEARARAVQLDIMVPFARPAMRATRSPLPNAQQCDMLNLVTEYSINMLHDPIIGRPGRDYLFNQRRLEGQWLEASINQIGYLPAGYSADLTEAFRTRYGQTWPDLARSIGILSHYGGEAMAGRVIFPVRDDTSVIYYQGRSIRPDDKLRYLGPPLRKYPFIPMRYAHAGGTFVVDGPVDAIAIAAQGFFSLATLGSSYFTAAEIKTWRAPLYLVEDADANGAGHAWQDKLGQLAAQAQVPCYRFAFTNGCKDSAETLEREGSHALRNLLLAA